MMNFSRDLTSDTMMRLARMKKEVEMLEKSQITAPSLKYSLNKFFSEHFFVLWNLSIFMWALLWTRGATWGGTRGAPPTLALAGTGCSSLTSAKFFPRPGSLSTPGSQSAESGGGNLVHIEDKSESTETRSGH